jgi:hypothetical protein
MRKEQELAASAMIGFEMVLFSFAIVHLRLCQRGPPAAVS